MTTYSLIQFTEAMDKKEVVEFAQRIESLGYDRLWVPEVTGRDPVALSAYLLGNTSKLEIGIGIANIYVRDYVAAAQVRQTLAEFYDGRFVLGLGVSHPVLVEPRGHTFYSPQKALGNYLRGIHATTPDGPKPNHAAPIICAAHGPKLLELVRDHADGAFCLNQPAEHTAWAREIIGPDKQLCVVVRACLETDPKVARRYMRDALNFYVGLPAYHRTWKRAGFSEADFENGGSDALLDAIFAWGNLATIKAQIQKHIDAGATEICFYPINTKESLEEGQIGGLEPAWDVLEAIAKSQ